MRTLRRTTLAVLAAILLPLALAGPANADSFRFWGFYQSTDDAWAFAPVGAGEAVPAHGSVDGWRFAVSDEASTRYPRAEIEFHEVCDSDGAEAGQKQVAVVVDFGTAEDAPDGSEPPASFADCATVPVDATSLDALAAVTEARVEGGLVCGVGGFPASGCGDPVAGAAPIDDGTSIELTLPTSDEPTSETTTTESAADDDSNTGSMIALAVGIVAIVGVGVAALARSRRSQAG